MKQTFFLLLTLFFISSISGQEVKRDTTFKSQGNPVIRYKYTADPAAMVYKGRFYLYTGHDILSSWSGTLSYERLVCVLVGGYADLD